MTKSVAVRLLSDLKEAGQGAETIVGLEPILLAGVDYRRLLNAVVSKNTGLLWRSR